MQRVTRRTTQHQTRVTQHHFTQCHNVPREMSHMSRNLANNVSRKMSHTFKHRDGNLWVRFGQHLCQRGLRLRVAAVYRAGDAGRAVGKETPAEHKSCEQ